LGGARHTQVRIRLKEKSIHFNRNHILSSPMYSPSTQMSGIHKLELENIRQIDGLIDSLTNKKKNKTTAMKKKVKKLVIDARALINLYIFLLVHEISKK
jgi:hypothetical protein